MAQSTMRLGGVSRDEFMAALPPMPKTGGRTHFVDEPEALHEGDDGSGFERQLDGSPPITLFIK